MFMYHAWSLIFCTVTIIPLNLHFKNAIWVGHALPPTYSRGLLQFALLCLNFQQAEPGWLLLPTHPSEADALCNAALRCKSPLVSLCTIHMQETPVCVNTQKLSALLSKEPQAKGIWTSPGLFVGTHFKLKLGSKLLSDFFFLWN